MPGSPRVRPIYGIKVIGHDMRVAVAGRREDARLIAAAPDLLAAAEWVERYVSDMKRRGLCEVPDPAVDALVAAMARARGESED